MRLQILEYVAVWLGRCASDSLFELLTHQADRVADSCVWQHAVIVNAAFVDWAMSCWWAMWRA